MSKLSSLDVCLLLAALRVARGSFKHNHDHIDELRARLRSFPRVLVDNSAHTWQSEESNHGQT